MVSTLLFTQPYFTLDGAPFGFEAKENKMATLIFDGDDTLWMNEWQYSEAYADYLAYLYKIFKDKTPAIHLI